jgi:hypothetical protein
MRNGFLALAATCVAGAGLAFGQGPAAQPAEPAPLAQPSSPLTAPADDGITHTFGGADGARDGGLQLRGEYLLWWIKDGPLPAPLATAGSTPGGAVVLGSSNLDYGAFSGGRTDVAYWFGAARTIGIDVSGFMLEQRSAHQAVGSDATGSPALSRPFVNGSTGQVEAFPISTPGALAGALALESDSRMLGAEINLRYRLADDDPGQDGLRLELLVGFRYFDLYESLFVNQAMTLLPATVPPTTVVFDRIYAGNQFFGGQLGAEAEYRRGGLFLDAVGKIALGSVEQNAHMQTSWGGFLIQQGNVGLFRRAWTAALGEFEARVGYQLTGGLRAYVGYDFVYLSSTFRPGNQIDLVFNSSPPRPAFPARGSEFWAQGLDFGLEFRF